MGMGKRKGKLRQQSMWIATQDLPRSASHPFYTQLNRILEQNGFDDYVEELCSAFYAPTMGRPSLAPGQYFRLLMLGIFRTDRIGTRDCLARGGLAERASVFGIGVRSGATRPFDDFENAAADRHRDAWRCIQLDSGATFSSGID